MEIALNSQEKRAPRFLKIKYLAGRQKAAD